MTARRSFPHRDGADLWTCPCLECVRLDWEASGEPGSFRAFLAQARANLDTEFVLGCWEPGDYAARQPQL